MFDSFNRFKTPINIEGKRPEKIVFTRKARSGSNFQGNFVFSGLLDNGTALENGDVFKCKDGTYLAITVRKTPMSVQAIVYKTNADIEVIRASKRYDNADNEISSNVEIIASVPTVHTTVNATMRLLDAGLLPSTTKQFVIPKCDIELMDRIVLNGHNYCVDAIDDTKYFGLYAVQTSNDERAFTHG